MSSSLTILLIDGSLEDLDYYGERLRRSSPDYVVIHAASGRTGLAICNNQRIDCVILELDLPDMSGFEVLLRLIPTVRHPEMPVIVLTRISNAYLLEAAMANGAQAALRKTTASGDILDHAIFKAIGAIPRSSKEPPHSTV
jgi:DNA-binding NarL/FixJ family response regulator